MTTTSVKIDKYTIQHEDGANVRVLRNDLPWLESDMLVGQKMLIAMADEIQSLRSVISASVVQSEPNAWRVTGTNRLYNQHDAEQEAKHCSGSSQAYPVYAQPAETDSWHTAVLNECMRIEAAYVKNDPVKTVQQIIDWHVENERNPTSETSQTMEPVPESWTPTTPSEPVAWMWEVLPNSPISKHKGDECGAYFENPADIGIDIYCESQIKNYKWTPLYTSSANGQLVEPVQIALADIDLLAKMHSSSYASPHHMAFSVQGLQALVQAAIWHSKETK